MFEIAQEVGALLPTFVISRLLLLAMRSWRDGGVPRLIVANSGSLVVATLVAGMGMANDGPFVPMKAFLVYLVPQLVWMVVDLVRLARRARRGRDLPFEHEERREPRF